MNISNPVTDTAIKAAAAAGLSSGIDITQAFSPITSGILGAMFIIFCDRVLAPSVKYLIDKLFNKEKPKKKDEEEKN